MDGFTEGFFLGMDREPPPRLPGKTKQEILNFNSSAVRKFRDITQGLIDEDVAKGHILGPFSEPPLENMVFSPLNIVPKAGNPGKWRLIHDLASPYNRNSVNSCIPEENSSVQYHYIDEVIDMGIAIGKGAWGCRVDINHAFRNLPIHFKNLRFLGMMLPDKDGNPQYYINASLPFGAASSCLIFERVASALQWDVSNETGCKWISHFLDDFPMLEKSYPNLTFFMHEFYRLMEEIGLPIAKAKTLGLTQVLEYLGLILNFQKQTVQVPEKKRVKCLSLVNELIFRKENHKSVTIKK